LNDAWLRYSSLRKIAAATPNAVPITRASTDVYSVPHTSARMPYRSVFGSHTRPEMNVAPYRWIAGPAEYEMRQTM